MKMPTSKTYSFKNLLSESAQIQTWRAIDIFTGSDCVLKLPSPDADIEVINDILSNSYRFQRLLTSKDILVATRKRIDNKRVIIEYPVLDTSKWRPLTTDIFWTNPTEILCKVCQIMDYLHISGLVHGDIKLDNFMICEEQNHVSIILLDLDFLCKSNTKPNSRVFGTPNHIAPEIVTNEIVVKQSDSFSLGISLGGYLDKLEEKSSDLMAISMDTRIRLSKLIKVLTQSDYLLRPGFLLLALREHDLISRSCFEVIQRELLYKLLLTQWRHAIRRKGVVDVEAIARRSNILGLGEELLEEIADSIAINRLKTFSIIKNYLRVAQITRHADYWHLDLDDNALTELYSQLQTIVMSMTTPPAISLKDARERDSGALSVIEQLMTVGHTELAYLTGRKLLSQTKDHCDLIPKNELYKIYYHLGFLAKSLNRLNEAEQHFESWLELQNGETQLNHEPLEALIAIKLALGKSESASKLVQDNLEATQSVIPTEHESYLERIRGWLVGLAGDYKLAENIFASVCNKSLEHGYHRVLMLTYYSYGVMFRRRGHNDQALNYLTKSLKIARQHQLMNKAVSVVSTLALVYAELAHYKNAVKHGRIAASLAVEHKLNNLLPSICESTVWAYTRLADFDKASYWIQRYLDIERRAGSRSNLFAYYGSLGFLSLNRSDLDSARQYLHQALDLIAISGPAKAVGTLYTNLADVELQRGGQSSCEEYIKKAQASFATIGDENSSIESQLLVELSRFIYRSDQNSQHLVSIFEKLVNGNRIYSSVVALFHLLVQDANIDRTCLQRIIDPLMSTLNSSRVPLFRATSVLLKARLDECLGDEQRLVSLKNATMELSSAESKFTSFFLLRAIAMVYLGAKNYRFAEKYLHQAKLQAISLANEFLVDEIQAKINLISDQVGNRSPLVESFHAVSRIVNEIDRSKDSLIKLLQFALNETCAERAALLLKRKGSSQFYVAASLHCDQQSVNDITDISRSVTRQVLKGSGALVIENALSDDRTKKYNSIIDHNILSVACIPLMHKNDLLGVVYLDHHTLPSLFSLDDIRYISAISNFLSAILKAVQSFGNLNQANIQLKQDLLNLGERGSFVTSDPVMIDLLEKIPEIAQANVPVLLLGESGTGKEILATMIHDKSLRAKGALIKLNCAAIAPTMIESELFGVARNAATGVAEHDGKLLTANDGTLFLDEIGDMSLDAQAKLLRAVEYQQFEKIGSNRIIQTDIRFVYASNKNLAEAVKSGIFRRDLYYRISTIIIEIPSLRDRPGDIELLIEHFLRLYLKGQTRVTFKPNAIKTLLSYDWPGNVRELKNLVERYCILQPGQQIDVTMLPKEIRSSIDERTTQLKPDAEKAMILRALKANNWIQSRVAIQLDIPLSTLRRKMIKLGITNQN